MSPRTRSAVRVPPAGSGGSSSNSKMLWPAAMPCCIGPGHADQAAQRLRDADERDEEREQIAHASCDR